MKLFAKYNRINLISTVTIFLLGCIAFAVLLRYVIIDQVDEDLRIEKNEIISYVNKNNHLPGIIEVRDQYTAYQKTTTQQNTKSKIFTQQVFNTREHEKELQRTIEFYIKANNEWYKINVSKSLEGTDDLIQTIIIITIAIILLILAASFFINRVLLRRLWQPFYNTLKTTGKFNLNNGEKLHFDQTNIDEFSYLNSTLTNVFSKAQNDYQTLKEFTENASHELQTPLAVIQSKLDILIQNETLSENESNAIQSAYASIQSLSRLNQSLLLLTKIENKQFTEQSGIDVKDLLQNKIIQFADLWKNKNITLQQNLSSKTIVGNLYLTEILINNLLSNATKHNIQDGIINVSLQNELIVTNAGVNHSLNKEQLFKRFSKQKSDSVNHGLGLSIINQVCIVSGYSCTYSFNAPNLHAFKISWQ